VVFLTVYISWLAVAFVAPALLSSGRMRPTIRNAFTLLRAGPALAALWQDLIRYRVRFVATPKGAGARAPLAAYGFPVAGVVVGGCSAAVAIGQLVVSPNFGLFAVAFWNTEFLILGLMALWIVRDRAVSRDVDTVIVQREGVLRIDGDDENDQPLEIVRLGVNGAIAVGPPGMHGATGVLRLMLTDGEYLLCGTLRCIPNRIVPRIKMKHDCYHFAVTSSGQGHDRLTDQIDARELWRFFGSLRDYPYKLPSSVDRVDSGMSYYPLRPRTPSFRF
jgi:hypothetical protein